MKHLSYLKYLLALCLLCIPLASAVGSSFSIVQGYVPLQTQEIHFEIYDGQLKLDDSASVKPIDGSFALTITFPEHVNQLAITPIVDGVPKQSIILRESSSITIHIAKAINNVDEDNSSDEPNTSISTEHFEITTPENEQLINDLLTGNTSSHNGEFDEIKVPSIPKKSQNQEPTQIPKNQALDVLDAFFLNPVVLIVLLLVLILLVILALKTNE